MPHIDTLLDQKDTTDSSHNQSTSDSLEVANDSIAAYRDKYWHKKHVFHYEYSPFPPLKPNIEKLFVYKAPFVAPFTEIMLLRDKKHLAEIDSIEKAKLVQDSIIALDTTALTAKAIPVDTIAAIQFKVPTNYFPVEHTLNLKQLEIPKAIQSLDSFNTANGLKVTVVFGNRVEPVNKTYFYNSEYVKIQTNNNLKINWAERDWLFWPLLGLVVFFILTRYKHRTFISQTVASVFYPRMSARLMKEKNESTSPVIQSLLFFYFLTTGLFVFMAMNYYGLYIFYTHGFYSYIVFSLLITVIYFLKIGSIKMLGYVFQQRKVIDEYIHNLKLFNITTGIFLLPVTICIPFLNAYLVDEVHLIETGFALYVIVFFFKLLRGFFVSYRQSISIFYILLYLCTLEILPLALLLRIVTL